VERCGDGLDLAVVKKLGSVGEVGMSIMTGTIVVVTDVDMEDGHQDTDMLRVEVMNIFQGSMWLSLRGAPSSLEEPGAAKGGKWRTRKRLYVGAWRSENIDSPKK
jgi:hypothetical protein